jgi:hypothetical protein
MHMLRKRWIPGIAGLLVLALAGCGGGGGRDVATTTIFSNPAVDADITRDLVSSTLSPPAVASVTGNILSGVTFTPPSGPSLADTRGFLEFPLGTVPLGATVQFASVSVFLNRVTLGDTNLRAPFFLDLIDTVAFPAPIQSSDYAASFAGTRTFDFFNTDQGNFVEIEVTSLMQEAQFRALPSFRIRFGFDEPTFIADTTTTRGLVEFDDRPAVAATAPLLRVDYF